MSAGPGESGGTSSPPPPREPILSHRCFPTEAQVQPQISVSQVLFLGGHPSLTVPPHLCASVGPGPAPAITLQPRGHRASLPPLQLQGPRDPPQGSHPPAPPLHGQPLLYTLFHKTPLSVTVGGWHPVRGRLPSPSPHYPEHRPSFSSQLLTYLDIQGPRHFHESARDIDPK